MPIPTHELCVCRENEKRQDCQVVLCWFSLIRRLQPVRGQCPCQTEAHQPKGLSYVIITGYSTPNDQMMIEWINGCHWKSTIQLYNKPCHYLFPTLASKHIFPFICYVVQREMHTVIVNKISLSLSLLWQDCTTPARSHNGNVARRLYTMCVAYIEWNETAGPFCFVHSTILFKVYGNGVSLSSACCYCSRGSSYSCSIS